MTEAHAVQRAEFIWGRGDITIGAFSLDGGVELEHNQHWHQLDAHGHPTCHSRCEDLEADAELAALNRFRQLVADAIALLEPSEQAHAWVLAAKTALDQTRADR